MLYNHSAKEEDKWFSISQTLCFGLSWIQIHVLEVREFLLEITPKEWDWIPLCITSSVRLWANYMYLNLRSLSVNGGNHAFPGDHWEDQNFISVTCGPFWHICVKIKIPWRNGSRKDNVFANVFYVRHWGKIVTIIATKVSPHSLLWKSSSFQIFPKRCVTYTGMCQAKLNVFQIQAQKCFCLLSWAMLQKISKWLHFRETPFL